MGKGKKKGSNAAIGGRDADDLKTLRGTVEAAVNEAVKIQDSAGDLPASEAAAALQIAAERYREALAHLPGHAEAAYNLATCLSEQADFLTDERNQVALLRKSGDLLGDVIRRDTSGRGATTALAHHALGTKLRSRSVFQPGDVDFGGTDSTLFEKAECLDHFVRAAKGNVIRGEVEVFRTHCPMPHSSCALGCPILVECTEKMQIACRHFEASVSIEKRLQNPSGGVDEVLVHWGDAQASMMRMVMEGVPSGSDGAISFPNILQEALTLCSNSCSKYSEALELDTSSGGSDADTLRLKAGVIVDFLDWALPQRPLHSPSMGLGFQPEELLAAGGQSAGILLGLDDGNIGGLLAKGDLSRLHARVAMLSGAGVQEEGRLREESVQWLARAVSGFPHDAEVLSVAGDGLLEYGRRSLALFRDMAIPSQGASAFSVLPGFNSEAVRTLAVNRLQEAGNLHSRAATVNISDTDSPYNAACAFSLSGDHISCLHALTEYCRRLKVSAASSGRWGGGSNSKEAARQSLQEITTDGDFESVRMVGWFVELMKDTDAALIGDGTGV